jgi:hypothetical protein
MSQLLVGAVNGIPTKLTAKTEGDNLVTFPIADSGAPSSIILPTDANWRPPSSRVAIIGGEEVGRDHFPIPPNLIVDLGATPTGEYTNYPLIVDLPTACQWFYLARAWRFNLTANYGKYVNGVHTENGSGDISVLLEPSVYDSAFNQFQPTTESDLLYDRRIGYFFNFTPGDDPSSGLGVSNYSNSFVSDVQLELALAIYFGIPKFAGGDFYFRLSLGFGTGSGASPSNTSTTSDLGDFFGYFEVTTTGDSILVPISMANDPTGLGTEYLLQGGLADLAPEVLWPYATKGGLPVYDTATGAQLRDPLS